MKKYVYVCVAILLMLIIIYNQSSVVEAGTPRYHTPSFYSIEELIEWIETESTGFQSGRFGNCLISARSHGEIITPSFSDPNIILESIGVSPRFTESGRVFHFGYTFTGFRFLTPSGLITVSIHKLEQKYAEIYEAYGIEGYDYAITEGVHEEYSRFYEKTVTVKDSHISEFVEQQVSYVFVDMLDNPFTPVGIIVFVIDGREVHIQYSSEECRVHIESLVLETVPIADRGTPTLYQLQDPDFFRPTLRTIRFEIGNPVYTIDGVSYTNDVAPFIDPTYNRTMLPLRAVSHALNAEVEWLENDRTVIIQTRADLLTLPVGVPLPRDMGIPTIVQNRTFIPARYVVENMDALVRWDSDNQAVYIFHDVFPF